MTTLILVAPVEAEAGPAAAGSSPVAPPVAGRTVPDSPVSMINRNRFDPGVLATTSARLDDPELDGLDVGFTALSRLMTHDALGRRFVSAVVDYPELGTVDLESRSSADFQRVVAACPGVGTVSGWVNRTLATGPDGSVPEEWTDPARSAAKSVKSDSTTVRMHCGWGNSVIDGAILTAGGDLDSLIAGLVDAQLIWKMLADLDARSEREVLRNASADTADDRSAAGRLAAAQAMITDLSLCNLAFDAAYLKLQGNRHVACVGLLEAWGFDDALDRVTQRISAVARTADQEVERGAKRFRDLTEVVLLAIALSGLIQLILAFIQTAYGGGTPLVPGDPDKLSTLRWIRSIPHLDLLIWAPTLLIGTMFAYLVRIRRRHGRG